MNHAYDVSHLLAGLMLATSFTLLYQDRIFAVLNAFALQAVLLSMAVAWEAWVQDRPHLYITAAIALGLKGIVIPFAVRRMVVRLGIHRDVEQVINVGMAMLVGLGLTALSLMLVLEVTAAAPSFTREGLALSLAVILLGFLMMITRRNAVTQIFVVRPTGHTWLSFLSRDPAQSVINHAKDMQIVIVSDREPTAR